MTQPYLPREREYYLSKCRYYHGEEHSPCEETGLFWFYEQCWVEQHTAEHVGDLRENLAFYKQMGGHSLPSDQDTPITLKALLFNRHCHWSGEAPNIRAFERWFQMEYLKNGNGN